MSSNSVTDEVEKTARLAHTERLTMLGDDLNGKIVEALRRDGRRPYSEIGQALGVSEGTIRNRVGAMRAAGVLRIVAITDPGAAEYRTEAMLGIKASSGCSPETLAHRLRLLEEVVYIAWVSGRFDLLVEVVAENDVTFMQLLTTHIHGPSDIGSVEIMTGLKNFKNQFLLKSNWS
ncbi:Lrp/AsnC family transcriptional regulator, regulator for asnA, asnC and gidA [Roseovarius tolerans]|uniref:Lrp/AsnC family transcriptional regulator, regulator for asnA, asnC and gidA n=1 Tax=Roseovarius tolerans TaxID=74031 RepID=A0A1H8IFA1_9RHOB|nr:AsnC family transcriptional regulator [Roseovarius tolerans]SEN66836.1 Lrp/AsnC family transcriptional regulator, regulator for asnA, asnC and gidA [Roseovarius tolerans]